MCSPTPQPSSVAAGDGGRIVEDPEQDRRIGGDTLLEPRGGQAEPEGEPLHHRIGDRAQRGQPVEDGIAQFGWSGRELVRPVQRRRRDHTRVVGSVFDAEVDPLLAVGTAGGQFAVDREPPPPGRTCAAASRSRPSCPRAARRTRGRRRRAARAAAGSTPWPKMPKKPIDRQARSISTATRCRSVAVDAVEHERPDVDHGHGRCGSAHDLVTYGSATGA